MEKVDDFLINADVKVMLTILVVLITGYLLYMFIRSPVKSFKFLLKCLAIFALGSVVWIGIFYLVFN